MAGLQFQYKFFPTDFFVPTFEPDPSSKSSLPQIVSLRSRKLSENSSEIQFPVDNKFAKASVSSSSFPAASIDPIVVDNKSGARGGKSQS